MTRIVGIADLHGNLPDDLPSGDVLVIAGDVCPVVDHRIERQRAWLGGSLYPWLEELPHAEVVWIAGNHDFVCETGGWEAGGRGHYLLDERLELAGVSFYGTPWVPNLPQWAFHASEAELQERSRSIPQVDVVVSHGPPCGYGDRVLGKGPVGSRALLDRLAAVPPRLCLFGHIHEGHGRWQRGETTLANVAHVDELYEVRPGAAQVFELEP